MKINIRLHFTFILFILLSFFSFSCSKLLMKEDGESTPTENFESLWKSADIHYSYFIEKNIDWDKIKNEYAAMIDDNMTDEELFSVLGSMLNKLQDGHVNLISPFNISRYHFDFSSPENFNYRLLKDHYIGWDYQWTGNLLHTTITRDNKTIQYIRYSSFMGIIEEADMNYIMEKAQNSIGIILDLRSNGGGSLTNMYTLASFFADKKRNALIMLDKKGPAHDDFGRKIDVEISPSDTLNYTKPVTILTNRACFSATSFFCAAMKVFPHIVQIGDSTGGGMGAPGYFELPNGWTYRMSVTRTLSPNSISWESGVPPDIEVDMDPAHEANGIDDIMEVAITYILKTNAK